MVFVAGQKVRASDLNSGLPVFARVASDVTVISSTTLVDITGLVVALDADALYAWDAYLAYSTNATADIKIAWTVPSGTTGSWSAFGLHTTAAGTVGDVVGFRADAYGDANTIGLGGSDTLSGTTVARPCGFIDTAGTAGNFQGRFAQNTSNANNTTLEAGSWLRAQRIA